MKCLYLRSSPKRKEILMKFILYRSEICNDGGKSNIGIITEEV